MESHLQHTEGHHYAEQEILPGNHDHNEDEHLIGEKKSMMQRVKDKARKIKNSITKHGHDDDDDDDDEEEDETVEDPEVHDAPNANLTQPRSNLEKPSVIAEDRYTKPVANHDVPPITKHGHGHDDEHQHNDRDETVEDPEVHGAPKYDSDAILTQPRGNLERPSVIAEDRYTKPVASHDVPPITKHGHGHDDEHQHNDRDETVEDPEVHGAPKYDSDAILTQPRGNLERPSVIGEDRYTIPVDGHGPPLTVPAGADGTNLSGQSGLGGQQHQVYGQEDVNPEKWTSKIGQPTGMEEEVPFARNPARVPTPATEHTYGTNNASDPFENHGQDGTHGVGKSTGMMKVPHAPSGLGSGSDPANDKTKVTNPTHTGGKEAGLSQEQHLFDKMVSGLDPANDETKVTHPTHTEGREAGLSQMLHPFDKMGSGTDPANDETKFTNPTHTGGKEAELSQMQHSFDKMGSGSDPANDETKVTKPTHTGGKEAGLSQMQHSFDKMGLGSDPANDKTKVTNPTHTGGKEAGLSQMQHSFDKMGIHDSGSERKRFNPEHPENLPHDTLAGNQSTQSSSYTDKISSKASAIAEKAGVAGSEQKSFHPENSENLPRDTEKISSTASAIPEKAPVAGSVRKRFDPEHPDNLPRGTFAGNQSTQSSGYTGKISSTASAIAEKAAVAKDVMASKLGYSGEHPTTAETHENVKNSGSTTAESRENVKNSGSTTAESGENVKNSGSTATDYAYMITDKVTGTLAPVYGKVVDAGSSVMSTVFGTGSPGTGNQQMHGTETVKGMDKGVSVKEGDEGKAHAIHRGNQEGSEKKSGEDTPMGRVTESV